MIGKSEWFNRRKYGGWGLTPKTWQGWVYIGVFIGITALIQALPVSFSIRQFITYILIALIMLDVIHMMLTVKKDEMESKVEALAERNSTWAMVSVLAVGIIYQSITSQIDMFLVITLGVGVVVKAISNWWLEHKGL